MIRRKIQVPGFRRGAKLPAQYLYQVFGEDQVKGLCATLLAKDIQVRGLEWQIMVMVDFKVTFRTNVRRLDSSRLDEVKSLISMPNPLLQVCVDKRSSAMLTRVNYLVRETSYS